MYSYCVDCLCKCCVKCINGSNDSQQLYESYITFKQTSNVKIAVKK